MALENWIDKQDGIDDVLAEDINSIANAVIDVEEEIEKLKDSNIVDQTFNRNSENAQSGKAVARELSNYYTSDVVDGMMEALKPKIVKFGNVSELVLEDNTEYRAREEITALTVIYPDTDFICSLDFVLAGEGDITIIFPESKYIGGAPAFANGETWELNIKNGVVVGGLVE